MSVRSAQCKVTRNPTPRMLDHLISDDPLYTPGILPTPKEGFTPLEKATPAQVQVAQVTTADMLAKLGIPSDEDVIAEAEAATAREAFRSVTTGAPDEEQKNRLVQMKTPAAVRHLVGMLAPYDWEFIEQAKELRGYAVTKILEETTHPDAKIRLRALELLGKVTEVALFTDRVKVETSNVTDADLDAKLKEKLTRLGLVTDARVISSDMEDAVEALEAPRSDAPQGGETK